MFSVFLWKEERDCCVFKVVYSEFLHNNWRGTQERSEKLFGSTVGAGAQLGSNGAGLEVASNS